MHGMLFPYRFLLISNNVAILVQDSVAMMLI